MFIGIDLGTSGLKAIVLDRAGLVRASSHVALSLSRRHPLWSEQAPQDWWAACDTAIQTLIQQFKAQGGHPRQIEAIGLTGQMHGATLLDAKGQVLRPAILWNDGRAFEACAELETNVPELRTITGNLAMPGFTAPKIQWVRTHEPQVFALIDKVLLPKDYLRYRMSGVFATDMSDAAGTLWLDVKKRDWSDVLLAATGLSRKNMPALFEGNQITSTLLPEWAKKWGLQEIPIVAGGGDNAAGALSMGVTEPGQAMLSLGTSGVFFVATEKFYANPNNAVHSFCHALPQRWHLMSVMLSAASCLDFTAQLAQFKSVPDLLLAANSTSFSEQTPLFLPYLTGERTPHNNPHAQALFYGLTADTRPADLALSTLEGVALGLADGVDALLKTGVQVTEISVIGGGARSDFWVQMLADVLNRDLICCKDNEIGPALGAARLAHSALSPQLTPEVFAPTPTRRHIFNPDSARAHWFASQRQTKFRALYKTLAPLMSASI